MTVWLVVSILALILSPMAWLRPSRKQSEQMNLRLEGRRMGLAMQLAPQQWPHWLERASQPLSAIPSSPAQGERRYLVLLAGHAGVWWNQWREPCADPRLNEAFARLPATVYKVEADSRMLALY